MKKYNQHLLYLFDIANKQSMAFNEDKDKIMNRIVNEYNAYIEDIDGKVLLLRNKGDDNRILVLPYIHRSHEEYIKKIRKRLGFLKRIMLEGVFLTITSNPNICMSYKDMHKRLSMAWNRLNAYIKTKYKDIRYIKVMEITKSGLLHLHVVFIGMKYLIDQQKLSKLLDKYGVGYIVHVKYISNGRGGSALRYIMKYITKCINLNKSKNNSKLTITVNEELMALSTALRARLYSLSNRLLEEYGCSNDKIKLDGEWEYIGSYIDKRVGYGVLNISYIEYIYSL